MARPVGYSKDEIKSLLEVLRASGVTKFKHRGLELELEVNMRPLPTNLIDDEHTLGYQDEKEAMERFKQAADERKKDLMWSVG